MSGGPHPEMMYGQWVRRVPLREEGPRDHAIDGLSRYLHGQEHDQECAMDFGTCGIGWHTESWFAYCAQEVYDAGTGGR